MTQSVDDITIRHCTALEEYRQCVELQRSIWGWEDEDLIPTRFFVVARKIEGQVIGAFDPAGRMVGFCLAVPGFHGPARYLHSHMLAVLPEYRRRGLGVHMKLEQRREALERGIRLIEWTFDPLEWKNAALNLNRLGAIARRYVPNNYGISSSPLHRGLPTDRLIAEWWLDSPRVAARANGQAFDDPAAQERIEFPTETSIHTDSVGGIAAVQSALRGRLQQAFAKGLSAIGFEATGTAGVYLLGAMKKEG